MLTPTKCAPVQTIDSAPQERKGMVSIADGSSTDFRDRLIRFWLLQYLDASPGRRTNSTLLREYLHHIGASLGRDALRDQLDWLARQGCIKLETVAAFDMHLLIASLTGKGADVTAGTIEIDGIARSPL